MHYFLDCGRGAGFGRPAGVGLAARGMIILYFVTVISFRSFAVVIVFPLS